MGGCASKSLAHAGPGRQNIIESDRADEFCGVKPARSPCLGESQAIAPGFNETAALLTPPQPRSSSRGGGDNTSGSSGGATTPRVSSFMMRTSTACDVGAGGPAQAPCSGDVHVELLRRVRCKCAHNPCARVGRGGGGKRMTEHGQ